MSLNDFPLPNRSTEYEAALRLGQHLLSNKINVSLKNIWQELAHFGLFNLLIPEDRLDAAMLIDVLMGLGEGLYNSSLMLAIGAHSFAVGAPILKYGTQSQRNTILPLMRNGTLIGAFAATEAEAGSDVMSLKTTYELKGDSVVLNGTKCFITNFLEANLFLVLATKDQRLHSRGLSAFLVPSDTKGISLGQDEKRLGLLGCSLGSVYFTGVVLPQSAILGHFNGGDKIFQHALLWERGLIFAGQVGAMRKQLEDSIQFVKSRKQFKTPIGNKQFIIDRIINIYRNYMTSFLLIKESAHKLSSDQLKASEASLTKFHISEAAVESSLEAFRIQGGSSYLNDVGACSHLIDTLGGVIYSGTSEIQKLIIASDLGLMG